MTTKNNRLPLDAIMACMADYAEACANERAAKRVYRNEGGHSWDYHGSEYIKAVEEAQESCEKELEAYIDSCIQAETEVLYRLVASIDPDLSRLNNEEKDLCKKIFAWCKENKR